MKSPDGSDAAEAAGMLAEIGPLSVAALGNDSKTLYVKYDRTEPGAGEIGKSEAYPEPPEGSVELFREFTFEAAHSVPPYSGVHGHSFLVTVWIKGAPDPVYGWPISLTEIDPHITEIREILDESNLNEIEGLEIPSLENVTRWIFTRLASKISGLDRIDLRRGHHGLGEGCIYRRAA
jgi:6-pyruvoyltetrahydropterin/6-carboxytetrahydropterin synthase